MMAMIFITFAYEAALIYFALRHSKKSDWLLSAPGLDLVISALSWVPWVVGSRWFGFAGFIGSVIGQLAFLYTFFYVHGKRSGYQGPTIRKTANQIVGRFNNQLGLLMTLPALPVFLIVRYAEILFYPALIWTMKFPTYRHGDWVNISRQKFSGLVGADLVWCLYCDWMTGLYALGGEMLRNLESFWCPIKFYPDKKCKNCQVDFPDIKEWVSADGSMEDVTQLIKEKYPSAHKGPRAWFGHASRENKMTDEQPEVSLEPEKI